MALAYWVASEPSHCRGRVPDGSQGIAAQKVEGHFPPLSALEVKGRLRPRWVGGAQHRC